MSDRDFETDLFGDRLVQPKEGRGRPEFEWTLARSNRVLLAFAAGATQSEAAKAIGCDVKTLRKHFSRECDERMTAELRMQVRRLERLNDQAEGGSVAAEKALGEALDRMRMKKAASSLIKDRRAKPSKPAPKGVKEERIAAAHQVGGRYEPRPAPSEVN